MSLLRVANPSASRRRLDVPSPENFYVAHRITAIGYSRSVRFGSRVYDSGAYCSSSPLTR